MTRTKLNDEHWHKLFIILRQINVYNKPNLRRTVEGMLYRIRVGCPWRDLPSYFGHWSRIYHQYRYWRKTGKWQKLMKIVTANYDSEWLFIDGSVVKAPQHSSGVASHLDEAIGKSVAGNSSKLHLVVDACGNPIHIEHRQIKYKNNVIECDHGKLKRIIRATLGFKSMKTAYATIKGIEVMRALRKGQASSFYYGQPQGEVCLINRVFGL